MKTAAELVAAANLIGKFVPRVLTKCLYIGIHAWLLIYPNHLNVDWADNTWGTATLLTKPHPLSESQLSNQWSIGGTSGR